MCQGTGTFTANAAKSTVVLQLPSCVNPMHTLVMTMPVPPGGFPPKANLQVLTMDNGISVVGYRYPANECNAAFTSCPNPFQ
jgi:hypothetical protein